MASLLRRVGRQAERAGDGRTAPGTPLHLHGRADQAAPVVHRMQPDAFFPLEGLLGNSDAVVPDAQEAFPIPKAQADVDPFSRPWVRALFTACWAMRKKCVSTLWPKLKKGRSHWKTILEG
jgi:hypothetical protein